MKDLSESRVLIVDDVKANVDVLVHALRDQYKLSVALDGASALRSIEKNPPDLVLLDIMMPPGIDGYEVCRQIRANDATREHPGHVPQLARGREGQGARLRGGRQRLPDEAVRDPRGQGARPLAAEGEGLRRRDQGGDGPRPAHRARDPDGHPARRPRRGDAGHRPRRARRHRTGQTGRRRPVRGPPRRRRPRRGGARRRLGQGHPGGALHGGGRDRAAHARPPASSRPTRSSRA